MTLLYVIPYINVDDIVANKLQLKPPLRYTLHKIILVDFPFMLLVLVE